MLNLLRAHRNNNVSAHARKVLLISIPLPIMRGMYKKIFCTMILSGSVLLTSCAVVPPPKNTENLCSIFTEYPTWYWDTENAARRWDVNIGTQMSIIYAESHFNADITPPREKLLGFIPWFHPTTAFGYSQALDHTWRDYQRNTTSYAANRNSFADSTDFIGWYTDSTRHALHTDYLSAGDLYLAYHEGLAGYRAHSYLRKPWLVKLSEEVQWRANIYNAQLETCSRRLPKKPWYWWG